MTVQRASRIACIVIGIAVAVAMPASVEAVSAMSQKIIDRHLPAPLAPMVPFIRNQGQLDDQQVVFFARLFAGELYVTKTGELVYAVPHIEHDGIVARWAFQESFVGRSATQVTGGQSSAVTVNSFKGSDSKEWFRHLKTYESVDLGAVYPGVTVNLKASANNVEKLFFVAPGADTEQIEIAVDGVEDIDIGTNDQLVLTTDLGEIRFTAPIAYQMIDGSRHPVKVAYVLRQDKRYGFALGDYDPHRELVIDPVLASTYLGGHNPNPPGNYDDDIVNGIAVGENGDIYIAGVTQSPDFPIQLGYDENLPNAWPDGFVTRMNSDLSTIIASTYIGTDGFDRVTDIAIDDTGAIIITGQAGYGFPVTAGAFNWNGATPTGGGFVARLSADLSTLLASAIPTPSDYPRSLELGNDGIYFGGATNNPSFPITPGAWEDSCCPVTGSYGIREFDGFAGKLSADLSTLEAMTYLDGDVVTDISVAADGTVFITDGGDNSVTGSISRFDAGLSSQLAYLGYYPGSTSGSSRTYFNAVEAGDGFVVAAGETYMDDLPSTSGAWDTTCGTDGLCDGVGSLLVPRSDAFVAVYSLDLGTTLALTYLGGSSFETVRDLVLGDDGTVYLSGRTTSVDFPTAGDFFDDTCGSDGNCDPTGTYAAPASDGFVARLSSDLSGLEFASYLGGSGVDHPLSVALDSSGALVVAGFTESVDFPTSENGFDRSYNGGTADAFISRIDAGGASDMIFADGFEGGSTNRWP